MPKLDKRHLPIINSMIADPETEMFLSLSEEEQQAELEAWEKSLTEEEKQKLDADVEKLQKSLQELVRKARAGEI